jgi:hypothetical protein
VLLAVASLGACGLGLVGERPETATSSEDAAIAEASTAEDAATPADAATPIDAALDADADAGPQNVYALAFTGGSFVSFGGLLIPADFTLEAWVRPTSFSGETYVVAKDKSGQAAGQFRLGFDATGRPFFMMTDTSSSDHGLYPGSYALQSGTALTTGKWTHLAVTKNGTSFTLYVDGSSVKSVTTTGPFVYGGPAVDFRVASRVPSSGTGASGAFDGAIDEVRLWKVARTQGDIAGARLRPIATSEPAFADLVGYWRFDEGATTTTADATGAHAGALMSSPTWITTTPF